MELRDRKRIKNVLPGFAEGWSPVGILNKTPDLGYNPSTYNLDGSIHMQLQPGASPVGITNTPIQQLQSALPQLKTTDAIKSAATPLAYDKIGGALLATAGAVGDIIDAHKYNKSAEQLLSESGTRGANAAGLGFTWQNDPEYQRELAEVRRVNDANTFKALGSGAAAGGAIGSIFGPVGGLIGAGAGALVGTIGGLFGGASRKRKAEEKLKQAEINAKVRNDFNRDDALTRAIRQQNAQEIGNPFASTYKYADGKSSFTPFGWLDVVRNAKGSPGEWLVEPGVGAAKIPGSHYKNGKPNTDDSVDINVRNTTAVLSNHGAALYYEQTGDLNGALIRDLIHRMNKKGYKNGKLPGFKNGYIDPMTNIIPSAFGGLASIYQYFDAKNLNIKTPNIYASNPYEQDAFAALNELKNNPYPTLWQLRDAEARTRNALDSSGGLGAGLKMLARIAQLGVTQSQWAKALADTQAYNNAQRAAVANAKLSAGNQDATRRQAANQFNEEYVAKAHAARQQGMQMGIYNFMQALQNYYANEFKRKQFGETLGLYKQQQALDLDKYYAYLNNK